MSVVSGIVGAIAGKKGADSQASAARDSARVQREMFDQTRADLEPWRRTGGNALAALAFETGVGPQATYSTLGANRLSFLQDRAKDLGSRAGRAAQAEIDASMTPVRGFTETPGYQFRVQQGQQGVDRQLQAMGLGRSGAMLKATERFRQGIAADEYGNYLNRLAGLANVGQSATNTTGALGAASAANQGNSLMAAGAARASGYNAIGAGIQQSIQGIGQLAGFGFGGGFGGAQTPPFFPGR